jgi:hypothetical protein
LVTTKFKTIVQCKFSTWHNLERKWAKQIFIPYIPRGHPSNPKPHYALEFNKKKTRITIIFPQKYIVKNKTMVTILYHLPFAHIDPFSAQVSNTNALDRHPNLHFIIIKVENKS